MRALFAEKSPHLGVMYDSAMAVLDDSSNPLRFSYCALALRELFREYFEVVSPDAAVKSCVWWKPAEDAKGGITRRDRTRYMIYGRTDPKFFGRDYVGDVEQVCKRYADGINALSKCVHVTEGLLGTDVADLQAMVDGVLGAFEEALELLEQYHEDIRERLPEIIRAALTEEFLLGLAFEALDSVSTHTCPTGIEDVEVTVTSVGDEFIEFEGTGTVSCELQWGSASDVQRGDGFEADDSFPFSFRGKTAVEDPRRIEIAREDIDIDTSSFLE